MAPSIDALIKREILFRKVVKLQVIIIAYCIETVDLHLLQLDASRLEQFMEAVDELYDDMYTASATEAEFAGTHEADFDTQRLHQNQIGRASCRERV